MKGKERCKILKEIRQKIADENGIEFMTSECKHKGDCKGTCPKCESELRYLERELDKKQRLGKRVAVAGIAATMVLAGTSCAPIDMGDELEGDVPAIEIEDTVGILPEEEEEILMGEIEAPESDETEEENNTPYIDENGNEAILPEVEVEIAGDLAPGLFFPETPEGFDGYSAEFITDAIAGMTASDIAEAWGEPDLAQMSGDRAVIAYFTDMQDIIFQHYLETGEIINVTTIDNSEG